MPLTWNPDHNPYELTYFTILGLGPTATRQQIAARRQNLEGVLKTGAPVVVFGRELNSADINNAATRLLEDRTWAQEVMLAHPLPAGDLHRLQALCRAVLTQTTIPPPTAQERYLKLINLSPLTCLLPDPGPDDIPWPAWEDLNIPSPNSPEDQIWDIQYDL